MHPLLVLIIATLLATASAQQQNQNQQPSQPQAQPAAQQKKQKQPPPQKPEEATPKTTEPAPSQPEGKPGDDKKEEHYDMTEVPPVVTHHQITVNGKTLKYTASTGLADTTSAAQLRQPAQLTVHHRPTSSQASGTASQSHAHSRHADF